MFETKEKLYSLSKACKAHSSKTAIYVLYSVERQYEQLFQGGFLQTM